MRSARPCSTSVRSSSGARIGGLAGALYLGFDLLRQLGDLRQSADRLGTLERNILRIGVYELEENAVPLDVAINEAVVLAKRYASEDAARLVNGILGRIARDGR